MGLPAPHEQSRQAGAKNGIITVPNMKNEDEIETTNNEELITKNDADDFSFEEVNEDLPAPDTDGQARGEAAIKKLRERIKKLEGEKQEYLNLSQRTLADYANFKKEVESGRASDRKFATKKFIEELLPVLDAYDMAKGNAVAWDAVDKNWRVGIEYIFGQLRNVLEKEGVVQFGKVGDVFDPALHESMEVVAVESESEHDKITRVLQSGYKMHDTILRPARVHVGHMN